MPKMKQKVYSPEEAAAKGAILDLQWMKANHTCGKTLAGSYECSACAKAAAKMPPLPAYKPAAVLERYYWANVADYNPEWHAAKTAAWNALEAA